MWASNDHMKTMDVALIGSALMPGNGSASMPWVSLVVLRGSLAILSDPPRQIF